MASKKKTTAAKPAANGNKTTLHKTLARAIRDSDWAAAAATGTLLLEQDPHDVEAIKQTAAAVGNLESWTRPLNELPKPLLAAALNIGADADAAMNLQFAIIDTSVPLAKNPKDKTKLALAVLDAFHAAGGKLATVHHYNNALNTYLAAGQPERAAAIAEEGLKKHKDPFGYHGMACAYGVLDNRKKLFATLEKAKETYGGFAAIQTDPDLAKWRKDEEFEAFFADAIDPQDGREGFSVHLSSVEKKFPKTIEVPELLKELAPWLAKVPFGSLGYFEILAGDKYRDNSLSPKANKAIADATGIFMTFGEGSHVALWNHGTKIPAVVRLDSEGQHATLAPSFEAFLLDWSKRKTDTELDGLYLDEGPPQQHDKLAGWLAKRNVKAPVAKAPDFAKWVDSVSKA